MLIYPDSGIGISFMIDTDTFSIVRILAEDYFSTFVTLFHLFFLLKKLHELTGIFILLLGLTYRACAVPMRCSETTMISAHA